jgi:hypothetical protein
VNDEIIDLRSSSSSSTAASFSRQRLHTRICPLWPNRPPLIMLEAQREQKICPGKRQMVSRVMNAWNAPHIRQ